MKSHRLATTIIAALLLAGCGSTTRTVTVHAPAPPRLAGAASCEPAKGNGTMGACVPHTNALTPQAARVSGCIIPDVSEFQGRPNWAQAKPHICGAIARVADMGTGRVDSSFAYDWQQLRRLHIWHAAYAFVRPGACGFEGRQAYLWVKQQGGLDSGPLIADAEVPLGFTCATDFTSAVEAASGWRVCVIYTAQGTWPGGTHGSCKLWDAAYGPSPGCVWTCARVAWQYTDGIYGPFPHTVPGIAAGGSDLSANSGLTSIVRGPVCDRACQRAALRRELHGREALQRRLVEQHGHLAHKLRRYGCSGRRHAHQRLGPICTGWFAAGDRVVTHSAYEVRQIKRLRAELGL